MKEWVDLLFSAKLGQTISLCQIPLNTAQRQKLLNWPSQTSYPSLRNALENSYFDEIAKPVGHSEADSLGLVVLWFAALYGQEHASEGEIWPIVAQVFPVKARPALFAQGQPKAALKAAMESACHRFGLRNAFGRQGGQAYYLTVFLQFGFTRQGLSQLPLWLVGHQLPIAVQMLRAESPQFQELWQVLQNGHCPDNFTSPFWPSDWPAINSQKLTQAKTPLSGRPVWSSQGQLHFEIDLAKFFPGLEDGSYLLQDSVNPEPWWIQVIDGDLEPQLLILEEPQQQICLSLSPMGEGQAHLAELTLWHTEPALWDETGRARNWVEPASGWTLLHPEQWRLEGPTLERHGCWVQTGSPSHLLKLFDQDGQLESWTAKAENPLKAVELRWEEDKIDGLPFSIEGILRHLPSGAKVRQTKQLETLAAPEVDDYYGSTKVHCQIPAWIDCGQWGLRISHQGFTRVVNAELKTLDAITWQVDGRWRQFHDQGQLDLSYLKSRPFRFLGDYSQYGLLENHRFLGRPPRSTSLLQGLSGYGAPLILRKGPFDAGNLTPRTLVTSITNQGLLRAVKLNDRHFQIELQHPLPPRKNVLQGFGDSGGIQGPALVFWDGESIQVLPYQDCGELPPSIKTPWLFALAYQFIDPAGPGVSLAWMGSYWNGAAINDPSARPNVRQAALLMRWAYMPLLQFRWQSKVGPWISQDPVAYAWAWAQSSTEVLEGLNFQLSPDEGWYDVLRQLLPTDLDLNSSSAQQLLGAALWPHWLKIHPVLLFNLLQQADCQQEIQWIRRTLGNREAPVTSNSQQNIAVKGLVGQAEYEMGVHAGWLEDLMKAFLDPASQATLSTKHQVALAFASFQRLLLRTLLD